MTKLTIAYLAIATLLAAGTTYLAMSRRDSPSMTPAPTATALPATHESDCPQCRVLESRIAELQQSVQTLTRERQPPAATVASAPPVVDEEEQAKRRAAAERERAEYMDNIAQSFANERVDMRWSHATTTQIAATIDTDGALRDRVNGIECRGQTCKVV